MPYYVYIASNIDDEELYKGFSENPFQRIAEHNKGTSQFTSTKKHWQLIFLKEFTDKKDALIFERKIKRWNKTSLLKLIASSDNLLNGSSVD